MQSDLSSTEQIILLVLCGFILAINLSLVFAFVHRKRDQGSSLKPPFSGQRMPWHSQFEDESAELTRRVADLKKNQAITDDPGEPGEDHQNSS